MDYNINFPNLGISLDHVGKSFNIGGFQINYYGVVIALGIIIAYFVVMALCRENKENMDHYTDLFLFGIICGIIGARLYYVIFELDYYLAHPADIFNIRQGGLAVYGGIIAGVLFGAVYCKVKKLNLLEKLDLAVVAILIGQIVGRWGNFFNREAFGEYTNGLFAMQLPVSAVRQNEITPLMWENLVNINGIDYIQVHPTFLYESMWNLCLLLLLIIFRKMMTFKGETFLFYVIGYGAGRFWIEALRTDQLKILGTIPVSQLLSALLFIGGLTAFILMRFVFREKTFAALGKNRAASASDSAEA
ncbi:MAG: prolipoprotein diacylglyceryl transferase [Lachnospiraceae bacterium]|jgi:phosphatidylglycerol:prolipoprotein diacylglycerol transferase